MKEKGIGVAEIAEKAGVTPRTFRRWLNGGSQSRIGVEKTVKIVRALDTTCGAILKSEIKLGLLGCEKKFPFNRFRADREAMLANENGTES